MTIKIGGSSYSAFSRAGDWDVTADDGEFVLDTSQLPPFGSWLLAAADGYGPAVIFPDSPAGTHVIHLGPIQTMTGSVLDSAFTRGCAGFRDPTAVFRIMATAGRNVVRRIPGTRRSPTILTKHQKTA